MEALFSDNKLGELEAKIDNLITTFASMREEKVTLVNRVESLETENRTLKEQMAKVQSDKEVIMHKVKGILEKIQKIEV